jgi:tryptophan 2,3-dioxygenase
VAFSKVVLTALIRLLVVLLVLAISLYLLLWAMNLKDEAPSAESLQLQRILQAQAPVAEQDNGFVFYTKHHAQPLNLPDALRALLQCQPEQCMVELQAAQAALPELLTQQQAVLASYQQLLTFPVWQYPLLGVNTQPHPVSPLIHMQQLYLLDVWVKTQVGELATAKIMLQQDLSFWRQQLVTSRNALYKAIAVSVINRHFMFADLLKQSLTTQQYQQLMPDLWQQPLTADELSLMLVMAGEWSFSNSTISSLVQFRPDHQQRLERWLTLDLWRPFLKQQAVSNTFALIYLACAEQKSAQTIVTYPWYSWAYNPIGKILTQTAGTDICLKQSHGLFDLEQKRQQLSFVPSSSV